MECKCGFGGNNELTEFLLKILLSRDDIHVKRCMTQKDIRNLFGRSVKLYEIAENVRFHKQEEKGVTTMCRIFEEYGNERAAIARAKAQAETKNEVAEKMIRQNKMTLEEIADTTDLPLERVKELAEKLSVSAMA